MRIFLFFLLIGSIPCAAQLQAALVYDRGIDSKPFKEYLRVGFTVRKQVSPGLIVYTGAIYKNFNSNLTPLVAGTDAISFMRDVHPTSSWPPYSGRTSKIYFSYFTVPVGLEFKLTTFLRIQYTLDNNFLLRTHQADDDILQYGKDAVSKYMFNHSAQLMFRGEGGSFYLGAAFGQTILRKDLPYTYDYMSHLARTFNNATMFYFGITLDATLLKKKKIL